MSTSLQNSTKLASKTGMLSSSNKNAPNRITSSNKNAPNRITSSNMNAPNRITFNNSDEVPVSMPYLHELQPAAPEKSKIRVRVTRKWQDYNFTDPKRQGDGRKFGMGYILADEMGNFAYAKLTSVYETRFKHKLQEQGVYEISGFNVYGRLKGYNPIDKNCVIIFGRLHK